MNFLGRIVQSCRQAQGITRERVDSIFCLVRSNTEVFHNDRKAVERVETLCRVVDIGGNGGSNFGNHSGHDVPKSNGSGRDFGTLCAELVCKFVQLTLYFRYT